MARLALNKWSLNQEQERLGRYTEFLPSLDMKRRQLLAELAKARRALAQTRARLQAVDAGVAERLPMLAYERIDLTGLVRVEDVVIGRRNVVGVTVPVLAEVRFEVRDYALLGRPHWVDAVVEELKRALRLHLEGRTAGERVTRLEQAVRKVTQRVNLFDKVLIPRSRSNIKRIRLYLSEQDRAAVVRAKLAKAKQR